MNQSRTLLVVGAHAADFVWRAAGVIAVVSTHGGRANVVALAIIPFKLTRKPLSDSLRSCAS